MTEVVLVRHAATAGNLAGRYNGRTDDGLSKAGEQAAARAALPGVAGPVYVSPMKRARQTAALLFPQAPQLVVEDFREMDFGRLEGKNHRELEQNEEYRRWLDGGCLGQCPGGESLEGFVARVAGAFAQLAARQAGGGPLLVVAHGGTLMAVMHRFAGEAGKTYFDWHADNLCGWQAALNEQTFAENPVFARYGRWAPAMGVQGG